MNTSEIMRSGRVLRWHQNPEMNGVAQSNAAHQWGVAVLILCEFPTEAAGNLLKAALLHDAGELSAGDLSGPFKNDPINADLKRLHGFAEDRALEDLGIRFELNNRELLILLWADKSEAIRTMLRWNPRLADRKDWKAQIKANNDMLEELKS